VHPPCSLSEARHNLSNHDLTTACHRSVTHRKVTVRCHFHSILERKRLAEARRCWAGDLRNAGRSTSAAGQTRSPRPVQLKGLQLLFERAGDLFDITLHTSDTGLRSRPNILRALRQVLTVERIHSRRQGVDQGR
jgi:hypothetical protein